MQIIIQAHGTTVTQPLREYAEKKLSKLGHFFDNIQKIDVILDSRTIKNTDKHQVAEVTIWAAGKKVIRAEAASREMYAAIDLVFDELKRQLKKHKAMLRKEKRRKAVKEKLGFFNRFFKKEAKDELPQIINIENFIAKPFNRAEAFEEIKVLNKDFLVFADRDSKESAVVYKTSQGDIKFRSASEEKIVVTPSEAVQELEKNKERYFVFKNRETSKLNVVYRHKSGNYALVESAY